MKSKKAQPISDDVIKRVTERAAALKENPPPKRSESRYIALVPAMRTFRAAGLSYDAISQELRANGVQISASQICALLKKLGDTTTQIMAVDREQHVQTLVVDHVKGEAKKSKDTTEAQDNTFARISSSKGR